jgi:hypothetical protein
MAGSSVLGTERDVDTSEERGAPAEARGVDSDSVHMTNIGFGW